jgi:hypothetical protein
MGLLGANLRAYVSPAAEGGDAAGTSVYANVVTHAPQFAAQAGKSLDELQFPPPVPRSIPPSEILSDDISQLIQALTNYNMF